MNVLLIGSGGREHALAWKLAASPLMTKLYAAPGNPGIAKEAELVALDVADHAAVAAFCQDKAIDLVVVGPEAPLVAGIADDLRAAGIKVFGPSKAAARLEGSKGFTKDLCTRQNIPTAAYGRFADAETADPTEEAEDSLRAEAVRKALAELGERERRVLALRFGFEGEPLSLDAIARELGLSRERVRQLEREALDRLEGELVAQGVEDGDLARSA